MLRTHPIDAGLVVTATTERLSLGPALDRRVEALWWQEQTKRATPLFNGELLSVVALTPSRVEACVAEYRCFVAQRRDPTLFTQLRLRPLAVSGLLRCRDGVVFGRRAATSTQDAGRWELVPSGGVDRRAVRPDGSLDVIGQLADELHEETGCTPDAVISAEPFLLVEDTTSGVVDIGIDLALDLDAAAVLAAYRADATAEYDALRIVPISDLSDFVDQVDPGVVEVSLALLQARKLLAGEA
ncbi:MAG: hypothetical protein ACREFI_19560 [Stellaceae bacterium]